LTANTFAAAGGGAVSNVQLEALKRLRGVNLESNPTLKAAVMKIVDATRGTPQFVELVEQFAIAGENEGLLDVAVAHPDDEAGVTAMRLVLDSGDRAAIDSRLVTAKAESIVVACVRVLGNTRLPAVNEWLKPLVLSAAERDPVRRESVKALAKNEPGARHLLALAREGQLDETLQLTAATALSQAGWPEVRDEAARLLPLPKAGGDEPLPSIADLVRRSGDPVNGEEVFFRESTACGRCHQVAGRGTSIGPDLSLIGDKLGRDALIESILDPNNGIAFGYEAWTVTLESDEEVYGLIVSETADELAVKDLSGIVHRLRKPAITGRAQSTFSLMPAGLQATMTVAELVDLIEYLSRLKKPADQP
jgi:putative heme-binding domain-containing protein